MPNKWITFVKQWASKKGISYGCALSQPQLKIDYRKANPTKKQEKFREAVERGEMEDEDIAQKKISDEKRRLIEISRMMGEDRNASRVKTEIAKIEKKIKKKKKPLIIVEDD